MEKPSPPSQSVFRNDLHSIDYNSPGKQTVVLIHGLGVTSESWLMQVPFLVENGYRVICPDIPGFGKSPWTEKTWSVHKVSERMGEWLANTTPDGCCLVGISMGGVFALLEGIQHPGLVKKLILVNTFARLPVFNPAQWLYYARRFYLVARFGLRSQAELVAMRLFPSDDQVTIRKAFIQQILEGDENTYQQAMRSLAFVNLEKDLRQIRQPVLVISGAEDTTIPLVVQTKLAASISQAKHVIIPNAGHGVIVDQAERFNQVLLDFLTAA